MYQHAASDYTAHELLLVYVAERIELLLDRMITRGLSRIALFGSREHAAWLYEHIDAMQHLPITVFVDRPDRREEPRDLGIPMLTIDDPNVAQLADAVLLSDDRCEDALRACAERRLPPGVLIHSLYNRLAIGAEPLDIDPAQAEVESKRPTGDLGATAAGYTERISRLAARV